MRLSKTACAFRRRRRRNTARCSAAWGCRSTGAITYRTIDEHSRRCSQASFIDLYHKGLVYRAQAPAIWCPECRASFAQADLEDRTRGSEFVTLPFLREDGQALQIATTRPELLAACVAVFVHPGDARYRALAGQRWSCRSTGRRCRCWLDPGADPEKGTGAVMCCTFGDQADVAWQRNAPPAGDRGDRRCGADDGCR